jgi:membrane protease subunit HflC
VVEIIAAAQRESEILRGEGEAERNAVFADAFSRDPEFFDFYRSMIAYDLALPNAGTTMVLSPDSEFFRYFSGTRPGGAAPDEGEGETDAPAPPGETGGGAAMSPPADDGDTASVPVD